MQRSLPPQHSASNYVQVLDLVGDIVWSSLNLGMCRLMSLNDCWVEAHFLYMSVVWNVLVNVCNACRVKRYSGLESIGQSLQCLQGQSPCAMVVAGMYWSISAMLAGSKSMRCGGLECVGQYLQCLQGQNPCAALVARMLAFGGSDA